MPAPYKRKPCQHCREQVEAELFEQGIDAWIEREITLTSVSVRDGAMAVLAIGGNAIVRTIAKSFMGLMEQEGATNYLTWEVRPTQDSEPFSLTLQRLEGKTAHQLRKEAEQERDEMRRQRDEIQERLDRIKRYEGIDVAADS